MKMLSAPPPRAASYLPNNFQLSRDFRRSKMQRIVSADKGRRCLREARLKDRAKFPFHIHRLRLNHDVGYCNIRRWEEWAAQLNFLLRARTPNLKVSNW
jgi:hypothetical protein